VSAEEPKRRRIEIVHESLLTKWPRLVHWQTQDAEGAQFRDELRQAAHLWHEHDRSPDFLWTGTAYREFQLWRERYPGNVTEIEEEFAQAIAAHAQRRRRRRTAALLAAFVALFLVIGIITLSWRRTDLARQRAETEARRATAAKLLALGQLELDSYPTAALAYATKSLEVADSVEARHFAVKALWRGPTTFILPLPPGAWYQLRFSPNGKWLAMSSIEGDVRVLPSSGGRAIVLPRHEANGNQHALEFGPKSDLLITKTPTDDPLRIWSVPDGKLLRRIDVEGPAFFVQRAGQLWMLIHTANTASRTLRRWVLPDGPAVDLGNVDMTNVADWDLDPTGTWLALARGREVFLRSLEFFNRGTEQLVGTNSEKVTWVAFGANGRLLSRDKTGEIRVWSLEGEKPRLLRIIRGSSSEESPRFDPAGSRVAAADPNERVVHIWDIAATPESEPLQLRRGDALRIEKLDFAATHGQWLAATNFTSISLWPLMREYCRVLRGHSNRVRGVRFGPDGTWVASGSFDGTVRIWPLHQRESSGSRVLLNSDQWIYVLAVDPSGKRIFAGATGHKAFLITNDGQPPRSLKSGSMGAAGAAAFDRRGRWVALGASYSGEAKDRIIRIWDAGTGEVVQDLDLLQGRRGGAVSEPWDGGVKAVRFAPDGTLYSAGVGGVRHWDIEHRTGETVFKGPFMIMDLSDDGRHILTATAKLAALRTTAPSVVRYHDLSTRNYRTLGGHGPDVSSVALDPTGTIAVTGSSDGVVRVGRIIDEEPHLLFGHGGEVLDVAVSPDGRWIASGGQDGTVRVWPMPDLSKPPLHALPHDKLLAKLKSLTNLRVIEDANSPNGYKLEVGPFPGWEWVPEW
jgi:WD40 repeat protein